VKKDELLINQNYVYTNSTEFIKKNVDFSKIDRNSKIYEKYGSIKELSKLKQKNSTYISEFDFTIDTTNVIYMGYGVYQSYTFPVTRENDNGLIENLLISKTNDSIYSAFLISYNLTHDEISQFNSNQIVSDFENKTSAIKLDDLNWSDYLEQKSLGLGLSSDYCLEMETVVPRCSCSGQHSAYDVENNINNGEKCCEAGSVEMPYIVISLVECGNSGGGIDTGGSGFDLGQEPNNSGIDDFGNPLPPNAGGDNPNTGNNPSDSNSNNSGDNNEEENTNDCLQVDANGNCGGNVTTILIPVEEEVNKHVEHCESLKKLTETDSLSANIKPIVDSLRTKTSENKEYSANFEKNINFGLEYNYLHESGILEGASRTESILLTGTRMYGQIHTHPDKTQSMFSWSDVSRIKDIYNGLNNGFDKKDIFIMIINHNGSVYTIKIDDFQKLSQAIQDDLNDTKGKDDEKKEKKLNREMKYLYNENQDNLEGVFLNKFKDFGISLYKATDQNLSNWNKLDLEDPNDEDSTVNSKTCN